MREYRFYVDFWLTETAYVIAENEHQASEKLRQMAKEDLLESLGLAQGLGLDWIGQELYWEDTDDMREKENADEAL